MNRDETRRTLKVATVLTSLGLLAGFATASWVSAAPARRMWPWIFGRGLGIAAYLALTALTAVGLWLRHPAAQRWSWPAPGTRIRAHAVLAALTITLILGHVVALVLDSFAHVGWLGAIVPGASGYRPMAVGLGTVSVYLALVVAATAALAGRLTGRLWRPIHRTAVVVFGLAWTHGLLAGSDGPRLRAMYAVTGGFIGILELTRRLVPADRPVREWQPS